MERGGDASGEAAGDVMSLLGLEPRWWLVFVVARKRRYGDLTAYAVGVSDACRRPSYFLFAGPIPSRGTSSESNQREMAEEQRLAAVRREKH